MLYLVMLAPEEAPGDFELTYTFVNSTDRDRHAVVEALGLETTVVGGELNYGF